MEWKNIDARWLSLYLRLNEDNIDTSDLNEIKHLLPERISKKGKAPSFTNRYIFQKYKWPQAIDFISEEMKRKMLGLAMEQAIVFFFTHFTYTFGGKIFLQCGGGQSELGLRWQLLGW